MSSTLVCLLRILHVYTQAELVLHSLLNLFIAVEAGHFVGTRGSNWNRLIDELRSVWPAKSTGCCNEYVEVDCTDTVQNDMHHQSGCDLHSIKGFW